MFFGTLNVNIYVSGGIQYYYKLFGIQFGSFIIFGECAIFTSKINTFFKQKCIINVQYNVVISCYYYYNYYYYYCRGR